MPEGCQRGAAVRRGENEREQLRQDGVGPRYVGEPKAAGEGGQRRGEDRVARRVCQARAGAVAELEKKRGGFQCRTLQLLGASAMAAPAVVRRAGTDV